MTVFQKSNHGVVELTPAGLAEIKKYPGNVYSDQTQPYAFEQRTWNTYAFASLWVGIIISIPVYMLASGLLSNGMNWWQALFTVVLGHTIVMVPAVLLGHFGTKYGTNFPLLSKFAFGPKGNVFPTLVRGILGCFWFGIQCWIGGTAVNSILSVLIPGFADLSVNVYLSFGLFLILNIIIGLKGSGFIKFIENYLAVVLIALCFIVIFWGSAKANGFFNVFKNPVAQGNGGNFWHAFWPALTSMIAFDSTIALNMSDFTRHAKSQKDQIIGQLVGSPFTTLFIVLVSIFGSVGSQIAFGTAIWEPATLVSKFDNPVVVIIFSLVILMAVLTTNVAGNLIPAGIVFSSLWGKIVKYKYAILAVGLIGVVTRPWAIIKNPDSYYNFINTVATVLGPMTGIYMVMYARTLKQPINLVDLYRKDGGQYYYTNGWNVSGVVVLILTTIFVLIGKFVPSLHAIYDSSYILGVLLSAILYYVISKFQKPIDAEALD
ncbi:NCS1 family nucleobase:cation symporter-1 [Agrilactobacillus yilanensis]|uniref:NCS1 family nucleobase:cation symporter-1 n=1 Tax=Agrilactobacillus yilanensis TaxID=2485997 RepID=A0ABW4J3Z9_9LACO|nr:NCS1 family nucleobase:cation symporter-1 [Agrilactobacillus yilanensis]